MPYKDKAKQAESARRHYEANKDVMKARASKYRDSARERLKQIVIEAKDIPCADCGVKYPSYVMDLDHVRGTKVAGVSSMVVSGYSEKRVREEIAKCEVVCANCHRIRTWKKD